MKLKNKLEFNWDVSALTSYVDQTDLDLISKAILDDPTANYVTIDPDIKSAKDIHTIESDPLGVAAGSAGFSPSGTTDLAKVTLSVDKMKINQTLDPYVLESYYTQLALKAGSIQDAVPFEAAFSEEKAKQVAKVVAKQIWQGDKTEGSGDLALANGWITDLAADGARVVGPTGAGNFDAANIIGSCQAMIAAQNADVLSEDDLVMFMSPEYYRTLSNALFAANYFHVNADNTVDGTFVFPATNVTVVRTYGLQGSNGHFSTSGADAVVLASGKYMYWGTDLMSDYSAFKLFYSEDNDEVRFIVRYKLGAAHLFGLYFVTNF